MRARLSALGLRPGMRCLEVGHGTGSMARWLVDQGATVTVIDLSDRYFDRYGAREVVQVVGDLRTAQLGGDHDFVVAQCCCITFRNGVRSSLGSPVRCGPEAGSW
jgi:cyclopropane fatty-acyl-phospholipid synthase-like methyltransferase